MNKEHYRTMEIAIERSKDIKKSFQVEVERLLNTGAIDESTSLALIFGVALENLADNFLRGDRATKAYRNLIKF